ncbi:hypothetical protein AXF42_Ash015481 [Apostasia shenzhenica]|uniref:Uncharacterized protein n=1 Tax=Apostasia shenzhenica TaxID=1088818 RepID=A0A2H9ZSD5_9ASPA|nr:hypothetical protein AXF42_Ash015481 [Apostasia shenzhenica]
MAKAYRPIFFKFVLAVILCFSPSVMASNLSSSPRPISVSAPPFPLLSPASYAFIEKILNALQDEEIDSRKQDCYSNIENGLWGARCISSMIEKENCALKCASPVCYELLYESDPLEEGERDYIRSQEFRYCMRRSSVGLNLDQVKGAFDSDVTIRPGAFSLPGLFLSRCAVSFVYEASCLGVSFFVLVLP